MSRLFAIVCALLFVAPASASDLSVASNEELIASFVHLESQSPAASAMGDFETFMAQDKPPMMTQGIVGTPTPSVPPAMRELVRRGVNALPDLLKHLDDPTATKIVVGGEDFMWEQYDVEYDMRARNGLKEKCDSSCELAARPTDFSGTYTVKIGDICFALVGQIVNRWFPAVRYQATGGLVVNSPIVKLWLARQIRRTWSGLTVAQHKESLLNDVSLNEDRLRVQPALARLRFYYPNVYAALKGSAERKREADEKSGEAIY